MSVVWGWGWGKWLHAATRSSLRTSLHLLGTSTQVSRILELAAEKNAGRRQCEAELVFIKRRSPFRLGVKRKRGSWGKSGRPSRSVGVGLLTEETHCTLHDRHTQGFGEF